MTKLVVALFIHYLVLTCVYQDKMIVTHINQKIGFNGTNVQTYVTKAIKNHK